MNAMHKKARGGILAGIGYILSPLSWWNDLLVNIPLAYAFAFPFGLISKSLFLPMMIASYWLTNIIGLILMHHGTLTIFSKEDVKMTRKKLIQHVIFSLFYTALVVGLVWFGFLNFPHEYFSY